jgi:predicted nucleic acid-binding protein
MPAFVIDASVASSWCFAEESTDYTNAILQILLGSTEAAAPSLWAYEIRNAVLMGLRRKRITERQAQDFLDILKVLNITLTSPYSFDAIYGLAKSHNLTFYDAAYLDLALREGLPIATSDKAIIRAAVTSGASVFQP